MVGSAEEPADDGEEDEDEVERVPALLDGMGSEDLGRESEKGRDDEEDEGDEGGEEEEEEDAGAGEEGGRAAAGPARVGGGLEPEGWRVGVVFFHGCG